MKLRILCIISSVLLLLCYLPLNALALEINTDDVIGYKGEEVEFTVELPESVTVKSGAIEVKYNPDALELVSAEWSLQNPLLQTFDVNTNKGAFAYGSPTEISGVIFILKCKVLDSAEYSTTTDVIFTLQLKDANNQPLEITNIPGSVTIGCRHDNTERNTSDLYLKEPATCTAKAEYYYCCSDCGAKLEDTYVYGEMLDHVYDQQIVSDDFLRSSATCSKSATYYLSCVCGKTDELFFEFGEYDLEEHNFGELVVLIPAGCESWESGYYECADCGSRSEEVNPPLGHDTITHDAKVPTCTDIGWDAYVTCSRCDYTTYNELEALGHDEVNHDAQDPTCTDIGWNEYVTCSRCDYTTYVEIPMLAHSYGEWAQILAPTCLDNGSERRDCNDCDHYETRDIAALNHDRIEHEAKAPTCTEIGWEEYVSCSRCDYSTYVEIAAAGHDYGDWNEIQAPTCTMVGEKRRDCNNCEHYETSELGMLGHSDADKNNICDSCGTSLTNGSNDGTSNDPNNQEQPGHTENGCGSSIGTGTVAVIFSAVLAGIAFLKRKKES